MRSIEMHLSSQMYFIKILLKRLTLARNRVKKHCNRYIFNVENYFLGLVDFFTFYIIAFNNYAQGIPQISYGLKF